MKDTPNLHPQIESKVSDFLLGRFWGPRCVIVSCHFPLPLQVKVCDTPVLLTHITTLSRSPELRRTTKHLGMQGGKVGRGGMALAQMLRRDTVE